MDAEVDDVGATPSGRRRVVRVTGGSFAGPKLRGTVLPGGGDRLIERADGAWALDVRITLRTDDGALIYAYYLGLFHAERGVFERIAAGQAVDPKSMHGSTVCLRSVWAAERSAKWLMRSMSSSDAIRA